MQEDLLTELVKYLCGKCVAGLHNHCMGRIMFQLPLAMPYERVQHYAIASCGCECGHGKEDS